MNHTKVRLLIVTLIALAMSGVSPKTIGQTQDARQIARNVFPSVVLLEMTDSSGETIALGSGFFVREDVIATNYHVIKGAAGGSVKIVGQNHKYKITGVVAADTRHDLVLLKLLQVKAAPLKLGDVSQLETGEPIYALGNPEGLEGTISPGIVSGMGLRRIQGENLIQITAPISHGSSGGPVVNAKGEVVGIAVSFLTDGQNLNFAVPAPYLALLLANMKPLVALSSVKAGEPKAPPVVAREQGRRFTSAKYGISFALPTNSVERELDSEGMPTYDGDDNSYGAGSVLAVSVVEEPNVLLFQPAKGEAVIDQIQASLLETFSNGFKRVSVVDRHKVTVGASEGTILTLSGVLEGVTMLIRTVVVPVVAHQRVYIFTIACLSTGSTKWFKETDRVIHSLTVGEAR